MPLNEMAVSSYAGDLDDETVEHCLDNLRALADPNSTDLVRLMRKEKGPLNGRFYRHSPVREYYTRRAARSTGCRSLRAAARIEPLTAERRSFACTDWLEHPTAIGPLAGDADGLRDFTHGEPLMLVVHPGDLRRALTSIDPNNGCVSLLEDSGLGINYGWTGSVATP